MGMSTFKNRVETRLGAGRPVDRGLIFLGAENFLFLMASRAPPATSQLSVQWVPGLASKRVEWGGRGVVRGLLGGRGIMAWSYALTIPVLSWLGI
jgi:hypothetical protein